jgi:hypothetical protein
MSLVTSCLAIHNVTDGQINRARTCRAQLGVTMGCQLNFSLSTSVLMWSYYFFAPYCFSFYGFNATPVVQH